MPPAIPNPTPTTLLAGLLVGVSAILRSRRQRPPLLFTGIVLVKKQLQPAIVEAGTPEGRVEEEFSKVFAPDQCSLDMLDPARFDQLLAGRRLIMFGDSVMRLQWLSLACMLRSQVGARPHLCLICEHQELPSLIMPCRALGLSCVPAEPDHVSCLSARAMLERRRVCVRSAEGTCQSHASTSTRALDEAHTCECCPAQRLGALRASAETMMHSAVLLS